MTPEHASFARPWHFPDGEVVTIRPIRPEDEPLMVRFHATLSERSVYLRYFHLLSLDHRVTHARLLRICFNDDDNELALVAVGGGEILAVARLMKIPGTNDGEFAILITDEHQGRGLGSEMLARLLEVARAEKLDRVVAGILPENKQMQNVCRMLGFQLTYDAAEGAVRAEFPLR